MPYMSMMLLYWCVAISDATWATDVAGVIDVAYAIGMHDTVDTVGISDEVGVCRMLRMLLL